MHPHKIIQDNHSHPDDQIWFVLDGEKGLLLQSLKKAENSASGGAMEGMKETYLVY